MVKQKVEIEDKEQEREALALKKLVNKDEKPFQVFV